MPIIIISIIIILVISATWSYYNLYNFEKNKKILIIITLAIITFIITNIIYQISKSKINYSGINEKMIKDIKNISILLFTVINSIIIWPISTKMLEKKKENLKSIYKYILAIIVIAIFLFEPNYMKTTQEGIISTIRNLSQNTTN